MASAPMFDDLRRQRPAQAAWRNCFAHDTQVICLRAWDSAPGLILDDEERSCFLRVAPFHVELIGRPGTLRWRFTLMWLFQEIAAIQLRPASLDLHAAALAVDGHGLLIVGPKGAGKTTLSFQLLRSAACRWIANDRTFASIHDGSAMLHGMPTAVKIRRQMASDFPALVDGLPKVERPYLYTLTELLQVPTVADACGAGELALSPAQILRQLGAEASPSAPLAAVVFPQIRSDVRGWHLQPLDPAVAAAALLDNLYGGRTAGRAPTVFEQLAAAEPADAASVVAGLCASASAYDLILGPDAYEQPDFARRLSERLRFA